ncbi:MAG: metal-dependent transcriptional regulator [Candidatus Bathyarchaeota archaeon]|nr:metal-dependent transcriptional regulator [Candidatus Bathyarchaeum tardum]WGM89390.1 MAG: metal-dependent transcriptional regulator [Candidatus Bathyarchaeum tardum]
MVSDAGISSKVEDYLRAIYEVVNKKGFVRIKDVARELDVKPPTAVEMMKKLDTKGLVVYEKYGGITLTDRGTQIAELIENRHETFKNFLEILLVPKDVALKDAHILEHELTSNTIQQFSRFVEFITEYSERPMFMKRWMDEFKKYCEQKTVKNKNS